MNIQYSINNMTKNYIVYKPIDNIDNINSAHRLKSILERDFPRYEYEIIEYKKDNK